MHVQNKKRFASREIEISTLVADHWALAAAWPQGASWSKEHVPEVGAQLQVQVLVQLQEHVPEVLVQLQEQVPEVLALLQEQAPEELAHL